MSVGPWQLILIVVVVLLLFGGGRVSGLMGDVAKGIKSFKKGLADDEEEAPKTKPAARIEKQGEQTIDQKTGDQAAKTPDEQKLNG